MPYRHFHDWSFHTHRRRPKGGNHWRAIRRRQRPWRVGFIVALALTVGAGALYLGSNSGDQSETATAAVRSYVDGITDRREVWQQTREAKAVADQDEREREIVTLINAELRQRGIGVLTFDPRLQSIARQHSEDMAAKNYFSHTNKAGQGYRQRAVRAGYRCQNPKWQGVAENLYFGTRGYQSPQSAVVTWLDSPLHKRAMLDPTFTKGAIGIHEGYLAGYRNGYFTTLLLC